MSRPIFTAGKDLVPIAQEAGLAPGPVWTITIHTEYQKTLLVSACEQLEVLHMAL